MNADSHTISAEIKAKAGKERQVRQELLSLVARSRKDAGVHVGINIGILAPVPVVVLEREVHPLLGDWRIRSTRFRLPW